MGGFVDPFGPEPAWPQDTMFIASSWPSSLADPAAGTYLGGATATAAAPDQSTEFHLQNQNHGSAKEMSMSPVELHEQFLRAHLQDDVTQTQQGLSSFEVDSSSSSSALALAGSLLTTPCAISLADSAPPVVCSSNDDSSGSEHSGLPRFLLGEHPAWPAPSTFPQISSLVGEETSQSQRFGFGGGADGKLGQAPLQLHGDVEFNMLSFTPGLGQQVNDFGDLQFSQKEFSCLHHLNLSGQQLSSFNATGATHSNPEQSSEVSSGKIGLNAPPSPFMNRQEVANANGGAAAGSGAPKPRVRARRGQATDPHSIAERLRREKISDRMKNLQELVPNSNRTDKASMLDEIIEYVKFLQLQVKALSMSRLGATEAVVPLLTESQTESSGGLLLSPMSGPPPSGRQRSGVGGSMSSSESRDNGAAFEQEVAQLMESNMTTAMQYLQSKGLCLMPIALASAISDQKGASSAAVQPENGEMLRAVKPLGSPIQGR